MAQLRIGISGWSYDDWRGGFYPADLPASRQLQYASRHFNSVEINGSFYSLRKPDDYRSWYEGTPRDFLFAVKGSRFITHNKKLAGVETPLANFFASGVLLLAEKLGPVIWQLPENANCDVARLREFFALLPRDTHAAARLARRHDRRLRGRASTHTDRKRRLRHALEVRGEAFFTPQVVAAARRFGVALVVSDAASWPRREELTSGFVYVRLHGRERTYASRYGERALRPWAKKVRSWLAGHQPRGSQRITERRPPRRKHRDVYVYFDNDGEGAAPEDALALAAKVTPHPPPRGE